MKTIVLAEPGRIRLDDTAAPQKAARDEALVRVHRVGICGTDLHAFKGDQPFFSYPRIMGHELAVEILELGESDGAAHLSVGDFCAVEPYLNCGTCSVCQRGFPNACLHLKVLGVHQDGGMREIFSVPIRKLHPANHLPLEQIALVEMLAIGAHAVYRSNLQAGETALVIGAGPIGMGTMEFAALKGAKVIAMDVNPKRLAFCRDMLHVQHTVESSNEARLREILGGEMPTVVFDATGNAASMNAAFRYVAHGGRLVFVGLVQDDISFNDPFFHSHEITLLASRNALHTDFQQVIAALENKSIVPERWITHQTSPEAIPSEFAGWFEPQAGLLKAMLKF